MDWEREREGEREGGSELRKSLPLSLSPSLPLKIVSLVPSQTELLCDLGLRDRLVGVTKFCVHPPGLKREKTIVGGTKNVKLEVVAALQPDLIIGNKEENDKSQIEALASQFPVWISDIYTLGDALEMIAQIGALTGTSEAAADLIGRIRSAFAQLEKKLAGLPRQRAAYFIWRKPYMAVGADTFIHHMLHLAGFDNVFGHLSRYPEITPDMLAQAAPQVILLSSEPYPFKEKHLAELQAICPDAAIRLVDGEMFSWYGSRLLPTAEYLGGL
jgi:ABC-type Fe3+-hydroxamate transport system substrate-binding protein